MIELPARLRRCGVESADPCASAQEHAAAVLAYLATGELNHAHNARLPLPPASGLLAGYRVVATADPAVAAAECHGLRRARVLGFDAEWRRGDCRLTCVQLCDERRCLVYEVRAGVPLPRELVALLNSPRPLKVGVALHNDAAVFRRRGHTIQGLVDVAVGARGLGFRRDTGTAALAAWILGVRLEKGLGPTFGGGPLTETQIRYAALDAVVAYWMHVAMSVPDTSHLMLEWEPAVAEPAAATVADPAAATVAEPAAATVAEPAAAAARSRPCHQRCSSTARQRRQQRRTTAHRPRPH